MHIRGISEISLIIIVVHMSAPISWITNNKYIMQKLSISIHQVQFSLFNLIRTAICTSCNPSMHLIEFECNYASFLQIYSVQFIISALFLMQIMHSTSFGNKNAIFLW